MIIFNLRQYSHFNFKYYCNSHVFLGLKLGILSYLPLEIITLLEKNAKAISMNAWLIPILRFFMNMYRSFPLLPLKNSKTTLAKYMMFLILAEFVQLK